MSFALSFASDYNVELPKLDFRIRTLPDSICAYTVKDKYAYIISLDVKGMPEKNIKTLVYNQVGQIMGLPKTTNKRDFMNDKYCLINFNRVKRYEKKIH